MPALLHRNSVFGWIIAATLLLLLIPLLAMQLSSEVNWDLTDFITMGALLFIAASLYVLLARQITAQKRLIVAVVVVMAFLYCWAELAVGIFFNFGS